MSGKKASGQQRVVLRAGLVLIVVALVTLLGAGTAFAADRWTDITDQQWIDAYGVTAAQAATVADGYPDGTFRPKLALNRGQAAKMVVDGFGIATKTPPAPTFIDVLPSHIFYPWVEGGVDADVISGYPDGTYRPNNTMARQQANTILARFLSSREKAALGGVQGEEGTYLTVTEWYLAEGRDQLTRFADANKVAAEHAPGTAYLVYHDVVEGSFSGGSYYLQPGTTLTRAQAVALILRVDAVTFVSQPPTVTGLNPTSGPSAGGNSVVISGTNFVGVSGAAGVKFGGVNATSYIVNSTTQITAVAPEGTAGTTVNVTVTTPAGTSSVAGTANDYLYDSYATAPSAIVLAKGATDPVGGVTNVAIPAAGATDSTGKVTGWIASTADRIKFTVTDVSPATSTITINGAAYSSGADYEIAAASPLTIVVTTAETGKVNAVRTFTVAVTASAKAPSAIVLAKGAIDPVGAVTNVQIPLPGATDANGAVTGWVANTADRIKFTVTDVSPATSTITINGAAYSSGADYEIAAASPLTIVVTTTETGKTTAVRTFTVSVNAFAKAPSAIVLAKGAIDPVGAVTNVQIPLPGATDANGAVTGWVANTADRIKFTVTDVSPATSTITINGAAYSSGADYEIAAASPLTIVVTTTETGKTTAVRTFTVSVAASPYATAPSAIVLAKGAVTPVGAVTNVQTPLPGGTDTHGAVTGWTATTHDSIAFTVIDVSPATSTITINGAPYSSGADYEIPAASPLTIVVTTTETGKVNAVRTFTVSVAVTTEVSIKAIPGVTPPVAGATPVTTISDTAQYTGTVSWLPSDNPFEGPVVYTATITLTAKAGYSFTGVDANFFTVAGAAATNLVNSGVVTAVFPATSALAVVTIKAIPGVTPPVVGATPVTTITETAQYTGTVSWLPASNPFAGPVVYTATITLTAKPGYTLSGVTANSFTVVGATTVTNAVNSGVVTAAFPATSAPAPVSTKAIPGVTPPVLGGTPVTTITATAQYTGTVIWAPPEDPFSDGQVYTAHITLTAKPGYTLSGVAANFFTVAGATSVTNGANSGDVTAVFPATAALSVVNVKAIPGVTPPVTGATPVTTITETAQYTGTVSWAPVDNPFTGPVIYTATITLTAKFGYTFTGVIVDFFTVAGATTVTNAASTGLVTVVFPITVDPS